MRAGLFAAVIVAAAVAAAEAAQLPGLGRASGTVRADAPVVAAQVDLHHVEKNVIYTVFTQQGRWRAVNLFPGAYDVTVTKAGFAPAKGKLTVAADGSAGIDVTLTARPEPPTYLGGVHRPEAKPVPYDVLYPPGRGRDIVERACNVCHGPNFIPALPQRREGWETAIDFMLHQAAWQGLGLPETGPSLVPPEIFGPGEREILVEYLDANFGIESEVRAVQKEREPPLDEAALGRAMFIEYRFANTAERPRRWTQEPHFDRDGNVWITERGSKPGIVKLDPRTGEYTDFLDPDPNGSPHGLAVDIDGTVWWAGRNVFLAHLDPKTGLVDQYVVDRLGHHGHTPVFASNGDLWFSMLPSNKIGHWSRATDAITYYEAPMARARPYGFVIDRQDKIWFVEYHTSAVTRFDPATKRFTRFPIKSNPASLRRLGVDGKGIVWFGVYGSPAPNGKLGRLDPATGAVAEIDLPIPFSNPYDAWADDQDNIWVSTDNYLVKYVPAGPAGADGTMTLYPTPTRTDMPKFMITREGAIWFTPRNAGLHGGLGGAGSVLYPDMDRMTTLAAYYSEKSTANHLRAFKGAGVPVTGVVKLPKGGQVTAEQVRGGKPTRSEEGTASGAMAD
jgi:virginiamycin B lyase